MTCINLLLLKYATRLILSLQMMGYLLLLSYRFELTSLELVARQLWCA